MMMTQNTPWLKALETWDTAFTVCNARGEVIAVCCDEAIAKKVQWAMASQQAESS